MFGVVNNEQARSLINKGQVILGGMTKACREWIADLDQSYCSRCLTPGQMITFCRNKATCKYCFGPHRSETHKCSAPGCTHPAGIGRSCPQHNDRECHNCGSPSHFSGHGKCPARGLHKSVDPEDTTKALHDRTTTGVHQSRPHQSRRGGDAVKAHEEKSRPSPIDKEKSRPSPIDKGKGKAPVRRSPDAPPTPRMAEKMLKDLPQTPHSRKHKHQVFTPLAIRPGRRTIYNASPIPYAGKAGPAGAQDLTPEERALVDYSHFNLLCACPRSLMTSGTKCPNFPAYLDMEEEEEDRDLDPYTEEEIANELRVLREDQCPERDTPKQVPSDGADTAMTDLTENAPAASTTDPLFEYMLQGSSANLSAKHQRDIQKTSSGRILIDGVDSQDPAISAQISNNLLQVHGPLCHCKVIQAENISLTFCNNVICRCYHTPGPITGTIHVEGTNLQITKDTATPATHQPLLSASDA